MKHETGTVYTDICLNISKGKDSVIMVNREGIWPHKIQSVEKAVDSNNIEIKTTDRSSYLVKYDGHSAEAVPFHRSGGRIIAFPAQIDYGVGTEPGYFFGVVKEMKIVKVLAIYTRNGISVKVHKDLKLFIEQGIPEYLILNVAHFYICSEIIPTQKRLKIEMGESIEICDTDIGEKNE